MKRMFYAAIGWLVWRYGTRRMRRKLHLAGR
jgi:hypothetical protein